MSIILFLVISLLLLVLSSVPIAFAVGLSSVLVLNYADINLYVFIQQLFSCVNNYILLAIPLFLFSGLTMNAAGVTVKLINFASVLVGSFRGGLAYINILVSMFFAGISGSSTADTAAVGSVLIPGMIRKGYSREFSAAVTAVSSTLGNIIPPSLMAIIYSAVVGVSVGVVFIAGIIPGIMVALAQMAISYNYAVKYDFPREEKVNFKSFVNATREVFLPMLTPVIIIGGIFSGYFTATEAAGIAAIYSLFLGGIVYRTINLKKFWNLLLETAKMSSIVMFTIGVSKVFAFIIGFHQIPQQLGTLVFSVIQTPILILLIIVAIFLIVGTFMDAGPSVIILMPIFAPLADKIGINPYHLAVLVIMTSTFGLVTPPYGLCLLMASSIAKVSVEKVLRDVFIFFIAMLVVILLILFFPELVLYIPKTFVPHLM